MNPTSLLTTFRVAVFLGILGASCARAESVPAPDRGGLFFGKTPAPEKVRRYYVAAEPELWDYTPSGKDEMCGAELPPNLLGNNRMASKLRYVRYTDETFTTKYRETPSLGLLGPVLRGVVGEYIAVTLLNRAGKPVSMHPHGVKYDKDSEGARYGSRPGKGAAIAPGETFTYVWQLDEASGPQPGEPSSKGWLYHSHVEGDTEINDGLVGFIVVTDPKRARPDGTPADVDRELAALFLIFDESGLAAEAKEAYEYVDNGSGIPAKSFSEIQQLLEAGARASINGRLFGNLRGLEMNEGERVRWYVFGLGSQQDFHTAHWHGQRVIEEGRRRTDVVELLPGSMKVVDLVADNPGDWMFQCHVADHMREGMFARLTVHPGDVVGVSRKPEHAFLGFDGANNSLHIARAEAALDLSPATPEPFHATIAGDVTVFEAFAIFRQPISVQIGQKKLEFHPDQSGHASAPGATWRVRNGGANGVIYGGLMEFELSLTGPDWLRELPALDRPDATALPETLSRVTVAIGEARHQANASIALQVKR